MRMLLHPYRALSVLQGKGRQAVMATVLGVEHVDYHAAIVNTRV